MSQLVQTRDFNDKVRSATLSNDGTQLWVNSGGSNLIWDLGAGVMVLRPLQDHTGGLECGAFSPDGQMVASRSNEKDIRVWDTKSGNLVGHIPGLPYMTWPPVPTIQHDPTKGHIGAINSLVFSSDGRLLISGSSDNTIRLWDTHTWRSAAHPIRINRASSAALSPDNEKIAGGKSYLVIETYATATGVKLFECTGHTGFISSVVFSPDGSKIISASSDHTVRIWNAMTGEAIGNYLEGHTSYVQSVDCSPDGRYIASASNDNTIRIWSAQTGTLRDTIHLGSMPWTAFFTPDGNLLMSYTDQNIGIWDVRAVGTQIGTLDQSYQGSSIEAEIPQVEITSSATPAQIVAHLAARGCPDITFQIDLETRTHRPISAGGFGDIYRCKLKDGTDVAMKLLRVDMGSDEKSQKHMKHAAHELYTWSKCQHLNVQALLGVVMIEDQLGMITKWEPNGSLPQYLERHPDADRCLLSTQIVQGLCYLHESGIVHGDLKGANVLISSDGVAQLADFGNAMLHEYTLQFTGTLNKEALSPRWALKNANNGVVATYRDPNTCQNLNSLAAEETNAGRLILVRMDMTDTESCRAAAEEVKSKIGRLDVLIVNAGVFIGNKPLLSQNIDEVAGIFDTNVIGPLRICQAFTPLFKGRSAQAKLVLITSECASMTVQKSGQSPSYCISKAGLNMMGRKLAHELEQENVAVGLFDPGWVQTDMGGSNAAITPQVSVRGMLGLLENLGMHNSGGYWNYSGKEHAW
ncbi:Tyrosine kinase family catalytic domain protein [Ceratobasidium sp. AG-Ba]|nr:Tyrosine kinase family catalytic domain protein [Ceratobasidium sp. AG-Ba]